jgi:hypothetical protein
MGYLERYSKEVWAEIVKDVLAEQFELVALNLHHHGEWARAHRAICFARSLGRNAPESGNRIVKLIRDFGLPVTASYAVSYARLGNAGLMWKHKQHRPGTKV